METRLRHHVSRLLSEMLLEGADRTLARAVDDVHSGRRSVLSAAELAVGEILGR